jgi:hypothetical protein
MLVSILGSRGRGYVYCTTIMTQVCAVQGSPARRQGDVAGLTRLGMGTENIRGSRLDGYDRRSLYQFDTYRLPGLLCCRDRSSRGIHIFPYNIRGATEQTHPAVLSTSGQQELNPSQDWFLTERWKSIRPSGLFDYRRPIV